MKNKMVYMISILLIFIWGNASGQVIKSVASLKDVKANSITTIEAKTLRSALSLPSVDCVLKADTRPLAAYGAFFVHVQADTMITRTERVLKDSTMVLNKVEENEFVKTVPTMVYADTTTIEIQVSTGEYSSKGIWVRQIEQVKDKLILTLYDGIKTEEYDAAKCKVFSALRWEGQ